MIPTQSIGRNERNDGRHRGEACGCLPGLSICARDRFEQFFRECADEIRRYAVRRVGPGSADDVVSETFMVAWRRWDDVPDEDGQRRAWIFVVARKTTQQSERTRRRRELLTLKALACHAPDVTQEAVDAVVEGDDVFRLVAGLPNAEREAMALVIWAGLTPTQAALHLGCSVSAVSTRLTRARRHLADALRQRDLWEQGL
ncbi:RNA polymerase sigma factor [Cellulomonas sp. P5_C6]